MYSLLSPIRNTAVKLRSELEARSTGYGYEGPFILELETKYLDTVFLTIKSACDGKCEILSDREFVQIITVEKNNTKQYDFTELSKKLDAAQQGHPIFVYHEFLTSDRSDTDSGIGVLKRNEFFSVLSHFKRERSIDLNNEFWNIREKEAWRSQIGIGAKNLIYFVTFGSPVYPDQFKSWVRKFKYSDLSEGDICFLLNEYTFKQNGDRPEKLLNLKENRDLVTWYQNRLSGIEEHDVRNILNRIRYKSQPMFAQWSGKTPGKESYGSELAENIIAEFKTELLSQNGRLELIDTRKGNEIKGHEALTKWLENHKAAMESEEPLKGILLVGLPGTGKSASAHLSAKIFEKPLVRMEIGKLLSKYQGEAEAAMREVQRLLRICAPCVLWIDEVEKAFGSVSSNKESSGNDVIERLFGMLLTFEQENKKAIFSVMTANDISKLPPEFFRSGRTDKVFCMMLPSYNECIDITGIKLDALIKRLAKIVPLAKDIQAGDRNLAAELFNFCCGTTESPKFLTGADIEAHIKELYYLCLREVETGKITSLKKDKLIEKMEEVKDSSLPVQASPNSPSSMRHAASSYLNFMQREMTMSGNQDTIYKKDNLRLDDIRYYSGKKKVDDLFCIKNVKEYNSEYKNMKNPSEWYDIAFFYELNKAMVEVLMSSSDTPPQTKEQYWKKKSGYKQEDQ